MRTSVLDGIDVIRMSDSEQATVLGSSHATWRFIKPRVHKAFKDTFDILKDAYDRQCASRVRITKRNQRAAKISLAKRLLAVPKSAEYLSAQPVTDVAVIQPTLHTPKKTPRHAWSDQTALKRINKHAVAASLSEKKRSTDSGVADVSAEKTQS